MDTACAIDELQGFAAYGPAPDVDADRWPLEAPVAEPRAFQEPWCPQASIRFGGLEVVPGARALVRDGALVDIGSRAFDILMVLLEGRGQIVPKDRIMQTVWPTTTVVDSNLKVQLSLLRRALGADRWRVKTVSGRGYLIVVEDACGLAAPQLSFSGDEGPLIIMIDAEPAVRHLMVHAISELIGRFSGVDAQAAHAAASASPRRAV
jgi:DNA-binding winged helix-turn-helix (wHTH) protein